MTSIQVRVIDNDVMKLVATFVCSGYLTGLMDFFKIVRNISITTNLRLNLNNTNGCPTLPLLIMSNNPINKHFILLR